MRTLELESLLQETTDKGFLPVFTDDSSEKFEGVGRLGGYGVYGSTVTRESLFHHICQLT